MRLRTVSLLPSWPVLAANLLHLPVLGASPLQLLPSVSSLLFPEKSTKKPGKSTKTPSATSLGGDGSLRSACASGVMYWAERIAPEVLLHLSSAALGS